MRLAQHHEAIRGDLGGERRALVAPVGNERIKSHRIDDGAGQDMRPDLGSLFEDHDRNVLCRRIGQLLEPDRRGEPARPASHDHDIDRHRLPFRHVLLKAWLQPATRDRLSARGLARSRLPMPAKPRQPLQKVKHGQCIRRPFPAPDSERHSKTAGPKAGCCKMPNSAPDQANGL